MPLFNAATAAVATPIAAPILAALVKKFCFTPANPVFVSSNPFLSLVVSAPISA